MKVKIKKATKRDNEGLMPKLTMGSPWVAAAGLAGLGGGLGWLLADSAEHILDSKTRAFAASLPGDLGSTVSDPTRPYLNLAEEQERMKQFRRRLAALSAVAAAAPMVAYGTYSHLNRDKSANFKTAHMVNYSNSLNTIQNDKFLNSNQKNQLTNIFSNANNRASGQRKLHGMLSTSDLIRGAVGAGIGSTLASSAGSFLGATMSMPTGMQKKLSDTGALAGALVGANIIS